MKKNAPAHAACVESRAGAGSPLLPAPAVVVVVVVLLITAGLLVYGMALEAVIAAVVTGGVMGRQLVRGLIVDLSSRRA
ncbi:hypothetical protein ACF06W_23970 [Streptomyces albus]|uniref:hypothetical protein n=1 Tax=Streptomyces albus TaxID=1888 RepID=UPI0036F4C508